MIFIANSRHVLEFETQSKCSMQLFLANGRTLEFQAEMSHFALIWLVSKCIRFVFTENWKLVVVDLFPSPSPLVSIGRNKIVSKKLNKDKANSHLTVQ